jgi:hypothetical protein
VADSSGNSSSAPAAPTTTTARVSPPASHQPHQHQHRPPSSQLPAAPAGLAERPLPSPQPNAPSESGASSEGAHRTYGMGPWLESLEPEVVDPRSAVAICFVFGFVPLRSHSLRTARCSLLVPVSQKPEAACRRPLRRSPCSAQCNMEKKNPTPRLPVTKMYFRLFYKEIFPPLCCAAVSFDVTMCVATGGA